MNKIKSYRIIALLLPLQVIIVAVLSQYPSFVERYYSNGLYPILSKVFRTVFGWIPFSVGDIYYFLLGLFLIYSVYQFFVGGTLKNMQQKLVKFVAFLSVFYFLFHLLWGLNYYRKSLYETLNLTQEDYTKEQLIALSKDALLKTKQVHLQITKNDTLKVNIEDNKEKIMLMAIQGYENLSKKYPQFHYETPSVKKSLFSLPLTYMGFSGYLNPFSNEANVDYLVPKHNLPTITTHEMAHQIGYASESEANFIGFLAAKYHDEPYYQYTAYLKALRFAVAATYGKDSIAGQQLIDSIPKGIKKNIQESQDFWLSYQNKAEPFFKLFYDNYLKANQQEDGIKGYSNMVGLLVAYHEKYGL